MYTEFMKKVIQVKKRFRNQNDAEMVNKVHKQVWRVPSMAAVLPRWIATAVLWIAPALGTVRIIGVRSSQGVWICSVSSSLPKDGDASI